MSKALDLHNEASNKAFLAQQAKLQNNFIEYLQISREAYSLEREAALLLKDSLDSEPTRSVLFRSAATLALNCGEYDDAIKLISHALVGNPHEEIKEELFEVLQNVSKERDASLEVAGNENAYLQFLRDKAINIKVDTKIKFYSRAVAVDSILDALKNVKTSIVNYVEVNFKKEFAEQDFNDFNTVLTLVKKDYSPLCVNLSFKSFSASICVDDSVMTKENNAKIIKWKENLFERFKEEVIEIDYESKDAIAPILKKYTEEERNLIYNPIIETVKEKNKYRVSITDKNFKQVEKTLKPISKHVQDALTPKISKPPEDKEKVLVQSYALTDDSKSFQKKDIFESHEIEYAEFSRRITEVSVEKEYLVVRNPFDVKIIYKKPDFIIEDDQFEIYTRAQTFQDIVKSYNRILLELFRNYSRQEDEKLSVDELAMKQRLLDTFTFGSPTE
jgi:hypothetical protein